MTSVEEHYWNHMVSAMEIIKTTLVDVMTDSIILDWSQTQESLCHIFVMVNRCYYCLFVNFGSMLLYLLEIREKINRDIHQRSVLLEHSTKPLSKVVVFKNCKT